MNPTLSKLETIRRALSESVPEHASGRLSLYALIDCAQHRMLTQARLKSRSVAPAESLFDDSSNADEIGPVLVPINPAEEPHPLLSCALGLAPDVACLSVVSSGLDIHALADHLKRFLYVEDVDGQRWMLALWDPAVFASLIGADPTQFIPGPIFNEAQRGALVEPMAAWSFWRRDGEWATAHLGGGGSLIGPIVLSGQQLDALGRVNWIDEILNAVDLINPAFGSSLGATQAYIRARDWVRQLEQRGRHDFNAQVSAMLEELDKLGEAANRVDA